MKIIKTIKLITLMLACMSLNMIASEGTKLITAQLIEKIEFLKDNAGSDKGMLETILGHLNDPSKHIYLNVDFDALRNPDNFKRLQENLPDFPAKLAEIGKLINLLKTQYEQTAIATPASSHLAPAYGAAASEYYQAPRPALTKSIDEEIAFFEQLKEVSNNLSRLTRQQREENGFKVANFSREFLPNFGNTKFGTGALDKFKGYIEALENAIKSNDIDNIALNLTTFNKMIEIAITQLEKLKSPSAPGARSTAPAAAAAASYPEKLAPAPMPAAALARVTAPAPRPTVEWVEVPEMRDAVAYTILKDKVIYIDPQNMAPMPKGLFAWRSQQRAGQPTAANIAMKRENRLGGETFTFNNGGWSSKRGIHFNPGAIKFPDPSESAYGWRLAKEKELAPPAPAPYYDYAPAGAYPSYGGGAAAAAAAAPRRDIKAAAQSAIKPGEDLFTDAMGMTEDQFKALFGAPGTKPDYRTVRDWYAKNKAALPERTQKVIPADAQWQTISLGALRTQALINLKARLNAPTPTFGSFDLILHDLSVPEGVNQRATDIRWLQEKYKNGWFSIASNPDALEGFIGDFNNNLAHMNMQPVQGETAAMSTMPAAIARRYFQPRINLWQNLGDKFTLTRQGETPRIGGLRSTPVTSTDMAKLEVGIHRDIYPTSGYLDDAMELRPDGRRYRAAFNKRIATDNLWRVNHILTSAHMIGRAPNDSAIAHAIQLASNEATVLSPIAVGAPTGTDVVLTALGISAFRNPIKMFVDALGRLEDVIIASGLNYHVVVRFDGDPAKQAELEAGLRTIEANIRRKKEEYRRNPQALIKNLTAFFNSPENWIE